MPKLAKIFAFAFVFALSQMGAGRAFAEPKIFVAEQNFCDVEFRAGTKGTADQNPPVGRKSMDTGEQFSTNATFLFARREGNPGVCGSGRGVWQRCSWDTCTLH